VVPAKGEMAATQIPRKNRMAFSMQTAVHFWRYISMTTEARRPLPNESGSNGNGLPRACRRPLSAVRWRYRGRRSIGAGRGNRCRTPRPATWRRDVTGVVGARRWL
jgi:hypothetical protein